MRTNRIIATASVAALALAGVATAAHATEHKDVVFWEIPGTFDGSPTSGNAFSNGPQDFHSYGKGKGLDTEPAKELSCNSWYQVDLYKKGHPFGPGSTLAGGHEDAEWIIDWRFIYGGDCVEPDPTPTPEPTVTPDPEPTPELTVEPTPDPETPACGPIGSCGTVPEHAEAEREFDASSDGPHYADAPVAEPAAPVVAEARFAG